jgi:sulfotransferase family protein
VIHIPLLVFCSGQRSGSTLLQRLLSSHPEVLIWGEHGGKVGEVLAAADGLLAWSDELGQDARDDYAQRGYQSFMANLSPDRDRIVAALRRFFHVLYAEPAAALGRPVWGIKEVRYGLAEARQLHRVFPDLAVMLLVRDPRDVLCSLDEWERRSGGYWTRRDTENAIRHWMLVAADWLAEPVAGSPPVLRLRYEDLIADPASACEILGIHTGLDAAEFDPAVFANRIRIGPRLSHLRPDLRAWPELPADLRRLLDPPEIRALALGCGYDVKED